MQPTIRDGEALTVAPIQPNELHKGDIVLSRQGHILIAHRVVELTTIRNGSLRVLTRGDASTSCDPPIVQDAILAKVVAVERADRWIDLDSVRARAAYFLRRQLTRVRRFVGRTFRLTFTSDGNRESLYHKETSSPINRSPADCASAPK